MQEHEEDMEMLMLLSRVLEAAVAEAGIHVEGLHFAMSPVDDGMSLTLGWDVEPSPEELQAAVDVIVRRLDEMGNQRIVEITV